MGHLSQHFPQVQTNVSLSSATGEIINNKFWTENTQAHQNFMAMDRI